MGQRRRARECALQMLYQIDQTAVSSREVFEQFWAGQPTEPEPRLFAEQLVLGVIDQRDALDVLIVRAAEHWRLERMSVVDRNVLRIAVYEMLYARGTPKAVIIDEAIEVAKRFGGNESGTFVNGVLDAIRGGLDQDETARG